MKNRNPNSISSDIGCYKPSKKNIKKKLKSAKEANEMIEDLFFNDYIPYEVATVVRGSIRITIENLEKDLKDLKDKK